MKSSNDLLDSSARERGGARGSRRIQRCDEHGPARAIDDLRGHAAAQKSIEPRLGARPDHDNVRVAHSGRAKDRVDWVDLVGDQRDRVDVEPLGRARQALHALGRRVAARHDRDRPRDSWPHHQGDRIDVVHGNDGRTEPVGQVCRFSNDWVVGILEVRRRDDGIAGRRRSCDEDGSAGGASERGHGVAARLVGRRDYDEVSADLRRMDRDLFNEATTTHLEIVAHRLIAQDLADPRSRPLMGAEQPSNIREDFSRVVLREQQVGEAELRQHLQDTQACA